jgi:hypothetical protein
VTKDQDNVAKCIRDLLAQHGQVLAAQPSRCEGLLRDKCANAESEVAAVIEGLKFKLPQRILSDANAVLTRAVRVRLARELVESRGLSPELADFAVQTWSSALGKGVEGPVLQNGPSVTAFFKTVVLAFLFQIGAIVAFFSMLAFIAAPIQITREALQVVIDNSDISRAWKLIVSLAFLPVIAIYVLSLDMVRRLVGSRAIDLLDNVWDWAVPPNPAGPTKPASPATVALFIAAVVLGGVAFVLAFPLARDAGLLGETWSLIPAFIAGSAAAALIGTSVWYLFRPMLRKNPLAI